MFMENPSCFIFGAPIACGLEASKLCIELLTLPRLLIQPGVMIWGFPKIRGTLLGVPIIRTVIFLGLYWGPLVLGNYHLSNGGSGSRGLGVFASSLRTIHASCTHMV